VTSPIDLRFEYRDSAGVHAVKTFHLEPSSYVVTVQAKVTEGDRALTPEIVWGPGIGEYGESSSFAKKAEGVVFENGKPIRIAHKDIGKQPVREGDFRYVGVDDNYFLTAALQPGPSKVSFQPGHDSAAARTPRRRANWCPTRLRRSGATSRSDFSSARKTSTC
jgi:YidC/Oxa1 family membrane protein insertase